MDYDLIVVKTLDRVYKNYYIGNCETRATHMQS